MVQADIPSDTTFRLASEQWQAVGFLAEMSRRMVVHAFPGEKTPAAALHLVREVYRVTDEMMAGCLRNGVRLACTVGCTWCCYLRVKATPLEVWAIYDFMGSYMDPSGLARIRQRLATIDDVTRGMDGQERVRARIACPLLVNARCVAYPVRPIGCRVYHSLDCADCETLLDDVAHSVKVRPNVAGLGTGLSAGLTEGLRTVGLKTRVLELTAGLRVLMDESGLAELWLAAERAFAGAEIAEVAEVESVHRALVEELAEPWIE
jgi:hypothetical protein